MPACPTNSSCFPASKPAPGHRPLPHASPSATPAFPPGAKPWPLKRQPRQRRRPRPRSGRRRRAAPHPLRRSAPQPIPLRLSSLTSHPQAPKPLLVPLPPGSLTLSVTPSAPTLCPCPAPRRPRRAPARPPILPFNSTPQSSPILSRKPSSSPRGCCPPASSIFPASSSLPGKPVRAWRKVRSARSLTLTARHPLSPPLDRKRLSRPASTISALSKRSRRWPHPSQFSPGTRRIPCQNGIQFTLIARNLCASRKLPPGRHS